MGLLEAVIAGFDLLRAVIDGFDMLKVVLVRFTMLANIKDWQGIYLTC